MSKGFKGTFEVKDVKLKFISSRHQFTYDEQDIIIARGISAGNKFALSPSNQQTKQPHKSIN